MTQLMVVLMLLLQGQSSDAYIATPITGAQWLTLLLAVGGSCGVLWLFERWERGK